MAGASIASSDHLRRSRSASDERYGTAQPPEGTTDGIEQPDDPQVTQRRPGDEERLPAHGLDHGDQSRGRARGRSTRS
ncbi:MAG TPA: hypothetical protein VF230_08250 [Acidimicrobiales bacterium]